MSFVNVVEDHEARSMSQDEKGNLSYRRRLIYRTDNVFDGPDTLRLYPGFPTIGSMYASGWDSNPWALCRSIEAKPRDGDQLTWDVDATYSTALDATQIGDNPLLKAPTYSWSFAQFTKPAVVDKDNNAVANSAREQYDPPIEVDDSRPVLSIQRNQASFNISVILNYVDAVNSDSWFGCNPRQAKMQNIQATNRTENGYTYWDVSYEVHFRQETWDIKPIDRGFHRLRSGGTWEHILDHRGQKVTQPKWLDGTGEVNNTSTPVFRTFRIYREVSFGALGLV